MKGAKDIRCPTLVVHAREDELTSLRSANFLVEQIGGGRARMVVLEDSYHMICVDNDREIVAKNVLEFFGAALPGATSALANEPRMTGEALAPAVEASIGETRRGDFSGLRDLAHPRSRVGAAGRQQDVRRAHGQDVRGVREPHHAGACTAVHRVRHAGVQSRRRARAGDARRVARRRVARVARRAASRLSRRQAARGALVRRRRRRSRTRSSASPSRKCPARFRSMPSSTPRPPHRRRCARRRTTTRCSRSTRSTSRQRVGDVSGERPGALDMVNRAKFDAWVERKGTSREDAMNGYIELVKKLKAEEGA